MTTEQVFIPLEEYQQEDEEQPTSHTIQRDPWEQTLASLASSSASTVTIPRTPSTLRRKEVISAFHDAFSLIGGTPRLALWADENPTEFYRLYSKLMPKESTQDINHDIKVIQVLPKSSLDG